MTTISDLGAPRIETIEPQTLAEKDRTWLVMPAVGLLALLVTLVNLGSTVYLASAVQELRQIDGRLEQLRAFERRVVGNLDTMNAGLQARLEDVQHHLQNFAAGSPRSTVPTAQLSRFPAWVLAPQPVSDASQSESTGATVIESEAEVEALAEEVVAESAPLASAQPVARRTNAPAYERIQAADGKVYYRQLR